jgi:uncharacterized protein with FMN-binding domain
MRRVVLAIVSTAVMLVLLLSFKSHETSPISTPAAVSQSSGADQSTSSTSGSTSSGSSSSTTKSASNPQRSTPKSTTKTVTGEAADTQYGPVQVEVTVKAGKVTAVKAVEYPENDPRDAQINAYAIPVLDQEASKAGSADIDMVSGATYTSQGYLQSLQSALDKAGL